MPPPRPKNSTPPTDIVSPCSTDALSQPPHARHSATSLSLFPGTRIVGHAIGRSSSIVEPSPSRSEAKSPAPTTISACAASSTSRRAAPRSRWRSLNASSLISCNTRNVLRVRNLLLLLCLLGAVSVTGPAAAIPTGPSAGDQQYVDPLG